MKKKNKIKKNPNHSSTHYLFRTKRIIFYLIFFEFFFLVLGSWLSLFGSWFFGTLYLDLGSWILDFLQKC